MRLWRDVYKGTDNMQKVASSLVAAACGMWSGGVERQDEHNSSDHRTEAARDSRPTRRRREKASEE